MDYDRWKTGWDLDESSDKCRKCDEKEKMIEETAHFLEGVIQQLYSPDTLDKGLLEHCLDEMCALLQVKRNLGDLQIQRTKPTYISAWLEFNKSYLESIAVHK